jgi:hypothetical protein
MEHVLGSNDRFGKFSHALRPSGYGGVLPSWPLLPLLTRCCLSRFPKAVVQNAISGRPLEVPANTLIPVRWCTTIWTIFTAKPKFTAKIKSAPPMTAGD